MPAKMQLHRFRSLARTNKTTYEKTKSQFPVSVCHQWQGHTKNVYHLHQALNIIRKSMLNG